MAKPTAPNPEKFEDTLQKLEALVKTLEEGKLSLEESFEKYQQGVGFYQSCLQKLSQMEKKIEVLKKNNEKFELQPFQDSESSKPDQEEPF